MEVTITMKGLEKLPEVAEENIKSKIGRLEKYFDNIQRCNVVINKVRGCFWNGSYSFASRKTIRGVGKGNLVDDALDNVLEKLETQIKKLSDRLKGSRRISKEEILQLGRKSTKKTSFQELQRLKHFLLIQWV